MPLTTIPAYITIVGPDHTIVLPEEIPIGAQVTITVLPPTSSLQNDESRSTRFAETLAAIQTASSARISPPAISDAELDALIKEARKAS